MTLNEEQKKIQTAMNSALSGLQEDPWLAQRVLAHEKGETPVVKKISVTAILIIVLIILSMTAALAAGLGLFGVLSRQYGQDSRLSALDSASENIGMEWTIDDDVVLRIDQAYYEGDRVFISYRMSGHWYSSALHDGAPDGIPHWDWEEDFIAAENLMSTIPERQQDILLLDGKSRRWIECDEINLHDGMSLADGTYLDIIGGEQFVLPDGSAVGWKECVIPEDRVLETLTFRVRLFSIHGIMFQDGPTYRYAAQGGREQHLDLTLTRNDSLEKLSGESFQKDHSAAVLLTAGHIDLRGTATLRCPDTWIEAWNTWDTAQSLDIIADWHLYRNNVPVSDTGLQAVYSKEGNSLVFDLQFPQTDDLEGLALVPEYSLTGEHPEEAIVLTKTAE